MRRGEARTAEFAAYVAARWAGLVRGVVEAGVPPAAARDVVADALSRCRREWLEADQHGDVDAVVEEAVARAVRRHRDPREQPSGQPSQQQSQQPSQGIDAGPAPSVEELDERTRRRRRRTTTRAGAVVVPLALLVALGSWWTTRGDDGSHPDDHLDDAEVFRQENQSQTVWFAAGRLHLPHVVLATGPLTDVTGVGDGAVYLDPSGRVVDVAADGRREVLGHQDPDLPLTASGESGRVAFLDTERDETRVVDAVTGRLVASRSGDQEVVAIDDATVYLRNATGRLRAWSPDTGAIRDVANRAVSAQDLVDGDLVDVRGQREAFQATPDTITVVSTVLSVGFTRPGSGARLSIHGSYVATTVGDEVQLYDTQTGLLTRSGLRWDDRILAATGGPEATTTYVVQTALGQRLLEDCMVATSQCTIAEQLDPEGPVPLLAH